MRGLRDGFRIGFQHREGCTCTSMKANLGSALRNPEVIDRQLRKEVEAGRVLGPVDPGVNHGGRSPAAARVLCGVAGKVLP